MRRNGFTLVELVLVMAIMGILLAMGTMQFSEYSRKGAIEGDTRMLLADLSKAKADAMLQRRDKAVAFTAGRYSIYSSAVTSGNPVVSRAVRYPITSPITTTILFERNGLVTDANVVGKPLCIGTSGNTAPCDSVIITETGIRLGKRNGGSCEAANITLK